MILNICFALILILGTFLSYIPQFYKIIKYKNSAGISNLMIFFNVFSSTLSLIGVFSDNSSCNSTDNCIINLLAIFQIITPWFFSLFYYFLYLFYFIPSKKITFSLKKYQIKYYVSFCFIINIITFLIIILSKYLNFKNEIFNSIFTFFAGFFSILMFLPQIFETYLNKNIYNLSILSLSMHCTGCILCSIYIIFFTNSYFLVSIPYILSFF